MIKNIIIFFLFISQTVCGLRICHINDFYHSDSKSLLCQFQYQLQTLDSSCNLITFGGDAFFPSDNAQFSNGTIMPLVLNELGVNVAIPGNHEFDWGLETANELFKTTQFSWILSNLDLQYAGKLNNLKEYWTIENNTVAFIGLWNPSLRYQIVPKIEIKDPIQVANYLIQKLYKLYPELQTIIALTHMTLYENIELARQVPGIDLFLTGHEHDIYETQTTLRNSQNKTQYIVTSLSDYRSISIVDYNPSTVQVQRQLVHSGMPCNTSIQQVVQNHMNHYLNSQQRLVFPQRFVDTRFVRQSSFNPTIQQLLRFFLGEFPNSDGIFLNGGLFREKQVFDLKTNPGLSFVINNKLVELKCPAQVFQEFILFGLSSCIGIFECRQRLQYVSKLGIKYNYMSGEMWIRLKKPMYRIVVTDFMNSGKDGYEMLQKCTCTNSSLQIPIHDYFKV